MAATTPNGAQIRRPFLVAGISAFVAWAVTGLFLSLIPSFIIIVLGDDNLALAGAVVALLLGPAALVQLAAQKLESLRAQTIGLIMMIPGVCALIVADLAKSLLALLIGALLAGLGQGLSFMGSLGDITEIAPEDRKGDTVASYYVVVYVGAALPAIGVGVLAQLASLPIAIQAFAYIVIAICIAGLAGLTADARSRQRQA